MAVDVATHEPEVGKGKGQTVRAMRLARSLAPADVLRVQRMKANGIKMPLRTLAAARKAKLDLAYACTLLEKESGGGDNVWGHDRDAQNKIIFHGQSGRVAVTEQSYQEYKRHIAGGGARQGCGPTQLTWGGFQDEADKRGGCWKPEVNLLVGFEILAGHIRRLGAEKGFAAYNGAAEYGRDAMEKLPRWQALMKEGAPAPKKIVVNPRNWWKKHVFGDTDCNRDVLTRLANVSKEIKQPIFIREGNRTREEQQHFWDLFQAGKGPRAARPGTSNHEFGRAADCAVGTDRNGPDIGNVRGAREALRRRGLCLPVTGEAWHVEIGNDWRG
jgi:hypothetical protein